MAERLFIAFAASCGLQLNSELPPQSVVIASFLQRLAANFTCTPLFFGPLSSIASNLDAQYIFRYD